MSTCIENKLTGQRILFLIEGKGEEQLVMRMSYRGKGMAPPLHYHIAQQEKFSVISGELMLYHQGKLDRIGAGHSFQVEPFQEHAMWNAQEGCTELDWMVYPALNTAGFFRESFAMANKQFEKGKKDLSLKHKIELAYKYKQEIRLKSVPLFLVRFLHALLFPKKHFGKVSGRTDLTAERIMQ